MWEDQIFKINLSLRFKAVVGYVKLSLKKKRIRKVRERKEWGGKLKYNYMAANLHDLLTGHSKLRRSDIHRDLFSPLFLLRVCTAELIWAESEK